LNCLDSVFDLKGEITVVIGPPGEKSPASRSEAKELLDLELARGAKPRDAVREVAKRIDGWSGKELYSLLHEQGCE
jgi:16S rRNA (cytidine1402-2'-O)-methyltransferase